ncbi:hypothetical protein NDA11_001729 [Ustilago hordei]|uniref:Uncharacterized protein n=1 Tax=Ustilago hordei TaxID=120017 RepID=I2FVG5_USTHO|nr:uncharacterized protein UHO2_04440 [Ustilago hordei]KAJ1578266.1 hypothetical protein NDA11_001729 [Ustilago hordei]CCF50908.1 uncharacterized protein UHOR_06794 [Ustilago hordei]SYW84501.1 uncharacterized protein UHO2_04440 [Ustilago hordei]
MISAGFEPATSSVSLNDPKSELLRRRANQLRHETILCIGAPIAYLNCIRDLVHQAAVMWTARSYVATISAPVSMSLLVRSQCIFSQFSLLGQCSATEDKFLLENKADDQRHAQAIVQLVFARVPKKFLSMS